jgi:hypothetical protein
LAVLAQLGVDYTKEAELTHLFGDDKSGKNYGQPADGHFAFVGRVLDGELGVYREVHEPFEFWVDTDGHSSVRATFGDKLPIVDLCFFVAEVPQATARATTT